jgi:hypothetical protein
LVSTNNGSDDVTRIRELLAEDEQTNGPADTPLPAIGEDPGVVAAVDRHRAVSAELDAVQRERAALEKELDLSPGVPEQRIRALAIVRSGTDAALGSRLTRLAELRERETVLAEASNIASAEIQTAREVATRALSKQTMENVYAPALAEFSRAYLRFLKAGESLRALAGRIQAAGVNNGAAMTQGSLPADAFNRAAVQGLLSQWINAGRLTRAEVGAALPGVFG